VARTLWTVGAILTSGRTQKKAVGGSDTVAPNAPRLRRRVLHGSSQPQREKSPVPPVIRALYCGPRCFTGVTYSKQRASVGASSTLADDPRQIILNTLKFVECRLRCAAQKGVAIVQSGGDYAARDCPSDVIRQ